ncbi:MAG TPA: HAMP domain-containing sensor histidine kinase [Polyangiaceae bacterium]|jgi:signal transduction histidine kinase
MRRLGAIHALARFARLVSEKAEDDEALTLLADLLMDHAGCDAVAVLRATADELQIAASRNLPEELQSWTTDADALDSSIGKALVGLCGQEFVQPKTFPLVSRGGLFGAVVLLWRKPDDGSEPWHNELAQGLVDLAAAVLGASAQMRKLEQTNDELRKSREVLARTEKLRALGEMAAGVSHDLKNILHPLSLHLQIAQRANAKGKPEAVEEGLRGMKEGLVHGVEVLERLRHFSRQAPSASRAVVDLNLLAREAVLLARPRLASASGRLCRVNEHYGTPPPSLGESGEILSAVLNLLLNASDAMSGEGEISVSTGERDGGGWIAVKDNGPGMSAEVQARVFEPFFTTKGEKGTGLGLATVYAAVLRHAGTVHLDSAPGQGATFTLWFPRKPDAQGKPDPQG